jgi:hypothetical protein
MNKARRATAMAIAMALLAVSVAQGHYQDWRPTGWVLGRTCLLDTRTADDTCGAYVSSLYWNSTRTTGLRHMLSEYNDYFTHDARDNSNNLNAVGAYSTLPLPYFDADDDNGDRKWEEGEVTSERQAFPTANASYYSRIHLMRWWRSCPSCSYQWDGGAGSITQVAQLSFRSCLVCDKYDADPDWNGFTFGTVEYPSKSTPSSVASASEQESSITEALERREREDAAAIPGRASTVESASIRISTTSDEGELHVQPDLAGGLDAYRDRSIRLSRALLADASARGIVTFNRPVSAAELQELNESGLEIISVEAVTEKYDGVRGTYFGLYGDHIWTEMDDIAAEFSTSFLGVTAAEVRVPNRAVFDAVAAAPDVYLVDLGVEQARRTSGSKDIVMNDLYWYLAGWETP